MRTAKKKNGGSSENILYKLKKKLLHVVSGDANKSYIILIVMTS
jgi:hypothetical protein